MKEHAAGIALIALVAFFMSPFFIIWGKIIWALVH